MSKYVTLAVCIGLMTASGASAQMGVMKANKNARMQAKEAKAARMEARDARMDRNMARRDLKNAKANMEGVKEARENLREERKEFRDARMDARKETKEARKARRKATRKNAWKMLQARLNMGMGGDSNMGMMGMGMARKIPPRVKNELRRHSRRIAKLQRMRSLAQAKEKTKLVEKIDVLTEKEIAKHQRRLSKAIDAKKADADDKTEEAE